MSRLSGAQSNAGAKSLIAWREPRPVVPKLGHLCWGDRITISTTRAIVDKCQYMKARRGADHVACDAH